MMAISLSGTDSHPSSDGAIQSRRVWKSEKRQWESPIAMTFSAFQILSISTKADCPRRARLREFIKLSFATSIRRSDWSLLSGFHRLPVRCPNHVRSDSKSAGTVAWRLHVGRWQGKAETAEPRR